VNKIEQRAAVGCGRLQEKPQPICGFSPKMAPARIQPRVGAASFDTRDARLGQIRRRGPVMKEAANWGGLTSL
jgi:hypothetical protein